MMNIGILCQNLRMFLGPDHIRGSIHSLKFCPGVGVKLVAVERSAQL